MGRSRRLQRKYQLPWKWTRMMQKQSRLWRRKLRGLGGWWMGRKQRRPKQRPKFSKPSPKLVKLTIISHPLLGLQQTVSSISPPWNIVWWAVSGKDFGHNRSQSQCFQVQLVTCRHLSVFLHRFQEYSPSSSKTIDNSPEVLNFNRSSSHYKKRGV